MNPDDPSRHVNNLLNTLRGEQFRHSQNVRKDRTHLLSSHTHNSRTLPANLIWPFPPTYSENESTPSIDANFIDTKVVAGPIPRSWALLANKNNQLNTQALAVARRIDALSTVLSRLPSAHIDINISSEDVAAPPLTMLCLRLLLTSFSEADFAEYVVPYLPPHLRRDLLRYTAVHAPLTSAKLYALCEPEGHADGEFIVIGPEAVLRGDHFRRISAASDPPAEAQRLERVESIPSLKREDDWDTLRDQHTSSTPLQTFILVACPIPTPTFMTLPPTLTSLALINLPTSVPIHRLPGVCPLLSILDLSHNHWLSSTAPTGAYNNTLERVNWNRWNGLKVLALRGCNPSQASIEKVNQGRWNDVEILLN